MSKRVHVELIDDLDGVGSASETVSFSMDAVSYEIDLSEKNAAKIRAAMQPFIDAGRKVGRAPRSSNAVKTAARDDLDAIRAWAQTQGKQVASRGRIAHAIQDEYDAAMAKPATKTAVKKLPAKAETVPAPAFSSS